MLKFRSLIIAILSLGICLGAQASQASALHESVEQITQLQHAINLDVAQLKKAKGELEALTEYRINVKTDELTQLLTDLVSKSDTPKKKLKPLIQHQLQFAEKIDAYLAKDTQSLRLKMGDSNNFPLILQIAQRENERNQYIKSQLQAINWAETIGLNVNTEKASLIKKLVQRGEQSQSLVNFIQGQLVAAIDVVNSAGKDATAEQTTKVANLKAWLAQSNKGLESVIALLDELKQDTASLKKTQFSISGDITQDVLNIDVASSLIQQWVQSAKNHAVEFGPTLVFKIFIFLIILVLASLIAKLVEKFVYRAVSASKLNFSKLLQDFFTKLSSKVVYTIGLLIALSQLGFELAPLLAGFGIAGVIIGFALQDTLSNFASGMMILIYRPFDVGDLINAAGVQGKVSHMSLVSTTIMTLDNQRLIVPNNKIWGDTINNITVERERRVDMVFGIGYSDDIEKAEKVLNDIVMSHPKVLKTPEPTLKLHTLNTSSVDFIVRPWTKPDDYWDVYWDITREVKLRFDKEGITIPFPQRDVHIYQTSAE